MRMERRGYITTYANNIPEDTLSLGHIRCFKGIARLSRGDVLNDLETGCAVTLPKGQGLQPSLIRACINSCQGRPENAFELVLPT